MAGFAALCALALGLRLYPQSQSPQAVPATAAVPVTAAASSTATLSYRSLREHSQADDMFTSPKRYGVSSHRHKALNARLITAAMPMASKIGTSGWARRQPIWMATATAAPRISNPLNNATLALARRLAPITARLSR